MQKAKKMLALCSPKVNITLSTQDILCATLPTLKPTVVRKETPGIKASNSHTVLNDDLPKLVPKAVKPPKYSIPPEVQEEANNDVERYSRLPIIKKTQGRDFEELPDKIHEWCMETGHLRVFPCHVSRVSIPDEGDHTNRLIFVEVMETSVESAIDKIDQIYRLNNSKDVNVTVVPIIGFNIRADKFPKKLGNNFVEAFLRLKKHMDRLVPGLCFPFVWTPTQQLSTEKGAGGGYIFPFLEARAIVTLHPRVLAYYNEYSHRFPIVRSMDAGSLAQHDPLLTLHLQRDAGIKEFVGQLNKISENDKSLLTGGYDWTHSEEDIRTVLDTLSIQKHERETMIWLCSKAIEILNKHEHAVRSELHDVVGKNAIYWPEPNSYCSFPVRRSFATACFDAGITCKEGVQQREHTYLVKNSGNVASLYNSDYKVVSPLKKYFDTFFSSLIDLTRQPSPKMADLETLISSVRQTHLDFKKVRNNFVWTDASEELKSRRSTVEDICQRHLKACAKEIQEMLTSRTSVQSGGSLRRAK